MTNIEIEQAFHAYFDRNNGVKNTSLVMEGFTGLSEASTLELLSVVPFCHEIVGDFDPSCETKESGGTNYEGSELSWVIALHLRCCCTAPPPMRRLAQG